MRQENLILFPSFPTNSILLEGLIDYLSDFFKVHCLDLPGFIKTRPPLSQISFETYTAFAEREIKTLDLDSYWLGGVSFGFFVAAMLPPDPHCTGFLAMEPYLGVGSLRMSMGRRLFYGLFCQSVLRLGISDYLWTQPFCRKYLSKLRKYPAEHVEIMFEQIDSRTFFETALLILKNERLCDFQNLPYVLIANQQDETLNYPYIQATLRANVQDLLVINTNIAHYPAKITKAYFRSQIPEQMVRRVFDFMPL